MGSERDTFMPKNISKDLQIVTMTDGFLVKWKYKPAWF